MNSPSAKARYTIAGAPKPAGTTWCLREGFLGLPRRERRPYAGARRGRTAAMGSVMPAAWVTIEAESA